MKSEKLNTAPYPKKFFKMIFGDTLDRYHLDIELRFRRKDSRFIRQEWYRGLEQLKADWESIRALNNDGYDVDFTVVPREWRKWWNREHPLPPRPYISCLWADIDEHFDRVKNEVLIPNILVSSGRGLHPYYCLRHPRELRPSRITRLLTALATNLGAEVGAPTQPKRLMRVPNTVNWKHGKLAEYTILNPKKYRLTELEAAWQKSEPDADTAAKPSLPEDAKYAGLFRKHVRGLVVGGNGFEARGLCPFHDDKNPSFSVNLMTGVWTCHSSRCRVKGNVEQFCERLEISNGDAGEPSRYPRLRKIPEDAEWTNEELFEVVHKNITNHIHFAHSWQAVIVCVWAMGTYVHRQFPCYGHLWLNSPTTHSGKSKLLNVLWTICYRALEPQVEPTPAALFRFPSSIGGTLLLDEVDHLNPEKRSDVIAVLNSYYSNATVMRNTPGPKKKFVLEKLPIFCPKVIAGIENLPFTLQDRCIKIFMHRKRSSERVERFMPDSFQELEPVREQLDAWAVRNGLRIAHAYSLRETLGVPREIDDRLKDLTEPLFAIASVLPRCVKEKLVEAAESLNKDRVAEEAESNTVVLGLQVLKEQFPVGTDTWRLRTDQALEILSAEIPAIETKAQAQSLLRRLGFRSKRSRIGKNVLRAYEIPQRKLEKLSERYQVSSSAV